MSDLASSLERIEAFTSRLIAAAEAGETGAFAELLERRGAEIELLRRALESDPRTLDDDARRELLQAIAMQAGDADAALHRLRGRLQEGLSRVSAGGRAVSGYDARDGAPSSLDVDG